jgi:cytochrome c
VFRLFPLRKFWISGYFNKGLPADPPDIRKKDLTGLLFIRIKIYSMILNLRLVIITGILMVLFLLSAGCTQTPATPAQTMTQTPSQTGIPSPAAPAVSITETALPVVSSNTTGSATKEEMVAFVQEAVAYAKQNGKENALAEFSNRNGSFFRGVLYIYAYDYNGTTIAHPVNPEKIGVNRLQEPDAEGTWFITNLREAAYNGTGFTSYAYINPLHNNTVEKKLGYAMKVDDSWWLGSGIYSGPAVIPAPVTTTQPA